MTDETQVAPEGATDEAVLTDQLAGDGQQLDAEAGTADDAGAQPKRKQTAQERIDELTWRLRETERQREADRKEFLDRLQTRPEAPSAPRAAAPAEDARPDPEKFQDGIYDPAYIEAVTDWKANQAVRKALTEHEANQARQTVQQRFESRAAELAKVHEDFHEVVGAGYAKAASLFTPPMLEATGDSPLGPEIAYHLAKNPAEAARIRALNPISQVREIGRLEATLAAPAKPAGKIATDAPSPTPQVRGAGGQFKPAPDTSDFAAFEKAYP